MVSSEDNVLLTRHRLVASTGRLIVFALLWWVMTEGSSGMVGYGVLFVPLATALSLVLLPPRRVRSPVRRMGSAAALFGWFLWQSLRGGVDVGLRAVRPTVDIEPDTVGYTTRLPEGLCRVALMGIASVMPGTLAVKLDDNRLLIHVLDRTQDVTGQFAELERRIGDVAGVFRA
ncbi:Na+/H+ antiporter subunit E [Hoyosella rhizosphaerae]|uniref:Na+/H+ antiporter subunit E n=1 Tax=Hoyosella rhizosphaerae TaxID=1755582 RepID=A0A916XBH5_9ACTN|nr:Na+/H+ antiporter subunit E [Hoyosella rhizosphaerae]MBN4926208.1 Na+/H+ antiporter subunit E [Hoyosella rhizosphaerae]GGC61230.1 hypothetical protein GCM10011410_12130 [Hoyosella rhizosphaerae]